MTAAQRKYTIAWIQSRRETGEDLVLTFSNGLQATFSKDDPAYSLYLRHAGLDGGVSPLGLIVEPPDRIVSLTWAMKVRPGRLGEEITLPRAVGVNPKYQGCYLLGFAGPTGVYRLAHDHPEFERIVATLEQVRKQGGEVWVSFLPDLLVLDVEPAAAVEQHMIAVE